MAVYPLISIIIFLILYCLSPFVGSVNLLNSSDKIVEMCLYTLLYFLSVQFHIKKKILFISITVLCIIAGVLYILHSITPSFFSFLKPDNLQFIIPTEGGHNHLGDLMGLGILSLLGLFILPIYKIVLSVFFIFLIVLSFSKSAFLALICTLFFIMLLKRGKYILIFICITGISLITVATYTKEFGSFKPVAQLQRYMEQTLHLSPKLLLSSRNIYIAQAAKSWISSSLEHSAFGFGPGNFIYASNKSAYNPEQTTTDTHSLLLTFIMESGMLTLFWFLFFFVTTLFIGWKTKNPLVFFTIYLFINFQTDYTYRMPFFFALFFLLLGQIAAPLVEKKVKILPQNLTIFTFLLTSCFLVYSIYINFSYKTLYSQLLQSTPSDNVSLFNETSKKLEIITPFDESLLLDLSKYNEGLNNNKEAVRLLKKLSFYSPHRYLSLFSHQLDLQKKMGVDLTKYIRTSREEFALLPYTLKEKYSLNVICKNYAKIRCVN